MEEKTLKKLKQNPFYKLSDKQKEEASTIDRRPMIEFGSPNLHNQSFEKHETKVYRKNKKQK